MSKSGEYQNKSNTQNEFFYDKNGNLTTDLDRDIVTIKYNLLNLPDIIQFKNGNQIRNLYDAGGRKLRTEYVTLSTPVVVPIGSLGDGGNPQNCSDYIYGTEYSGNFEYKYEYDCDYQYRWLDKIYNQEGYTEGQYNNYPNFLTSLDYYYYRRDHLGNNREVWCGNTNQTSQRTQYYPSGLPWAEGEGQEVQNKKYNGKEWIEAHGLDEYDSQARMYYPAIMRTTTPDPLAEKYYSISPYAWCGNNPVNRVDPDGRSTYVLNNDDGTYRVVGGNFDDDDLNIYLFSAGKNGELTRTSIGKTTSMTSFYDSDNSHWRGTIDPNDNSGKEFLDNFVKDNPEMGYYMDNAKGGQKYDFKRTNGTNKVLYTDNGSYYRGMPVQTQKDGTKVYTSARDVGNIAAGYIAGLYGVPWEMARKQFDALESQQKGYPTVEGISSQNAQRVGWNTGMRDGTNNPGVRFFNWINSIPTGIKLLFK